MTPVIRPSWSSVSSWTPFWKVSTIRTIPRLRSRRPAACAVPPTTCGLIRKALVDAGYPQIPVIAISTQGIEDNPGFTATPALLHRAVKALIIGDLLMKCLYRVRPYEVTPGSANQLYETWDTIVRETLENHGRSKTARKFIGKDTCRIRRSSRRSSSRSTRCR